MNKVYNILFFVLSFQSFAQQQSEYFTYSDSSFHINSIKRVPGIFPDCIAGLDGSYLDEDEKKNIDSIVNFLAIHKSIILELGVKEQTVKRDKETAEYFKSCIAERGGDSTRIVTRGYGRKYQPYSSKEIRKLEKENTAEASIKAEEMRQFNFCFELKILQQ